jgi:hypothetical protein
MNKHCPICFGIGWVCENHPDRAWDKELGFVAAQECRSSAIAAMSRT